MPGLTHDEQHQSCIEGLKRAAEVVEGKSIKIFLENIDPEENPRYFLTSVAEGFEIIKAVNHPQVQFLYDFYHEQIAEGNLIEKLEKTSTWLPSATLPTFPTATSPAPARSITPTSTGSWQNSTTTATSPWSFCLKAVPLKSSAPPACTPRTFWLPGA